ncbi:MAG: hydroxyethylthiazole kinase-like uncharacterized protein yjeF, partial [Myxococcota bacterium]
VASLVTTDDDLGAPFLPPRHPNSHKGHFGHVLMLAGSPGKGGAALLASTSAMRAGAGLVTLATHERCQMALEGREPDIMVEAGWGGAVASDVIAALLENKDIIGIGPGLSPTAEMAAVLRLVLGGDCPVVLDAGALSLLAAEPELFDSARAPLVLTPHPGEAARLLGVRSVDIQADRFGALEELVELTGGIVALKGARTLIGAPDGRIAINRTGGPALAKAGTGDVLMGIICAFLARDLDPFDAVRTAVHVHGLAGDRAADVFGDDSVVASDLPSILSAVLKPSE